MKNGWFFETLFPDAKLGLKIKKDLYSARSKFQKIRFLDTYHLGKFLILDDIIQTSTWDEFIYHEMISHIPLFSDLTVFFRSEARIVSRIAGC